MGMSREEFVAKMTTDMAKKRKENDRQFYLYQCEKKTQFYGEKRSRERYFRNH